MTYRIPLVFTPQPEGGYTVTSPALPELLTEGDTPLATIVPIEKKDTLTHPRTPGLFPGIWTSDDFDEPLPDEFWFGEE